VPVRNEFVIGVVAMKSGETLKLDIGSSEYASLSFLGIFLIKFLPRLSIFCSIFTLFYSFKAFENATKRNKPNVDIGDLLYCRILTGNKDMEPELVCIDGSGKANGLGVLKEGFMFKINLELGRR
jgi:exosome complex component RRP40